MTLDFSRANADGHATRNEKANSAASLKSFDGRIVSEFENRVLGCRKRRKLSSVKKIGCGCVKGEHEKPPKLEKTRPTGREERNTVKRSRFLGTSSVSTSF